MSYDWCYECAIYDGDYIYDDGDLVCYCPECPLNPYNQEGEEDA